MKKRYRLMKGENGCERDEIIYLEELPEPEPEKSLVGKIASSTVGILGANREIFMTTESAEYIAKRALDEAERVVDEDGNMNDREKRVIKDALRNRFLGSGKDGKG